MTNSLSKHINFFQLQKSPWRLPFLLLAAGSLMSGCESMRELDKAAGEWARAQRQGSASTTARQVGSCLAVNEVFTVPGVDVDTAYLRVKRYFDLSTFDERQARNPFHKPRLMKEAGVRHETLPGVRYWMRDEVSWRPEWGMKQQEVWMSARVEREGAGSRIELDYCIGGETGFIGGPGFQAKLKAGAVRAVKGGS